MSIYVNAQNGIHIRVNGAMTANSSSIPPESREFREVKPVDPITNGARNVRRSQRGLDEPIPDKNLQAASLHS
jgi:hypothetical protein